MRFKVEFAGELSCLDGVIVDVTEQREAQEAVVTAKQRWERTFDAVPDLICIIDTSFRIRRINRAAAAKLGVKQNEAIGRFCYECTHGSSAPPEACPCS